MAPLAFKKLCPGTLGAGGQNLNKAALQAAKTGNAGLDPFDFRPACLYSDQNPPKSFIKVQSPKYEPVEI